MAGDAFAMFRSEVPRSFLGIGQEGTLVLGEGMDKPFQRVEKAVKARRGKTYRSSCADILIRVAIGLTLTRTPIFSIAIIITIIYLQILTFKYYPCHNWQLRLIGNRSAETNKLGQVSQDVLLQRICVMDGKMSQEKPLIHVQNASNRILRSPSHESISTEVSLLSLSSLNPFMRIPSPIPDIRRLTVPNASEGFKPQDLWIEEENDLIKNFGALFKYLGLPKSFSTTDISSTLQPDPAFANLRKSSSELDISQGRCSDAIFRTHFGPASRTCSTWVAVGDVSSSQLPSPQGRVHLGPNGGSFTPADLIRSVNKKIRQLYIRKRLLVAYRALERLTQNDFDLDKLPVMVPMTSRGGQPGIPPIQITKTDLDSLAIPGQKKPAKEIPVTLKDVERERGRPLSKFERNMMIFNWLHNLDEESYESIEQ